MKAARRLLIFACILVRFFSFFRRLNMFLERRKDEKDRPRFSKTCSENDHRGARYLTIPPIERHRFPPLARHWSLSYDSTFPGVSLFREGIENSLTIDDARTPAATRGLRSMLTADCALCRARTVAPHSPGFDKRSQRLKIKRTYLECYRSISTFSLLLYCWLNWSVNSKTAYIFIDVDYSVRFSDFHISITHNLKKNKRIYVFQHFFFQNQIIIKSKFMLVNHKLKVVKSSSTNIQTKKSQETGNFHWISRVCSPRIKEKGD